jgi:lipoic acid synthetase
VVRHVPPEEFDRLAEVGRGMGFSRVHAGPLVRTSYRAAETFSGTTAEPLGT